MWLKSPNMSSLVGRLAFPDALVFGSLGAHVFNDGLRLDLLLDIDGHGGHGQVGAVLLVLALQTNCGSSEGSARVERGFGRALVIRHKAQLLGRDVHALVLMFEGGNFGGIVFSSHFPCLSNY